jgi:predicted RNA-binding protein YlxR (DUF448 family)
MQRRPKSELLRFVASEQGLVIDESGKAQRRGIYLCKDSEKCLQMAVKRRKLPQEIMKERQEVF